MRSTGVCRFDIHATEVGFELHRMHAVNNTSRSKAHLSYRTIQSSVTCPGNSSNSTAGSAAAVGHGRSRISLANPSLDRS